MFFMHLFKPAVVILVAALILVTGARAEEKRLRFENGLWFDGEKFRRGTVEIEYGTLNFNPPRRAKTGTKTVDLAGGFVTPPFCEAHTHNLGVATGNAETIAKYLQDGIYYVKVLTNVPYFTGQMRHLLKGPRSVDASFANQGITGSGGHPIRVRETLWERGSYPGVTKEWLKDNTYFVADSHADIERFWPIYLSFKPDFTKLFLLHSDEYEKRKDDPGFVGDRGLSPKMFRKLVSRAHEYGLRVSVHIDSVADFSLAVDAGADELAHILGRRSVQRLERHHARAARDKGVILVTTTALIEDLKIREPELHERIRKATLENLKLLKEEGVTLAIGSDMFIRNAVVEAFYLYETGIFTEQELLMMWTENCAKAIFPNRRIGQLRNGYEASFLVLEGDPLKDFSNTRNIVMRVKDGVVLDSPRMPSALE